MPARLLVLISGSGRTMANLAARCADGTLDAAITRVVASRPTPGVELARSLGVRCDVLARTLTDADLLAVVNEDRVDWVVLAGYLRKVPVPRELTSRILNIHPALLPGDGSPGRFGGPGMHGRRVHEAVLRAGERESGCTVHLVSPEYDAGPVLHQRRCPVLEGDTPDTLAARVFEQELLAYPEALRDLIARGRSKTRKDHADA